MNRLRNRPLVGGHTKISLMHTSLRMPGNVVDTAILNGNVIELARLLSIGHWITTTVLRTFQRATLIGDHVDMVTYLLTLPEIKDQMISHITHQRRAAVIGTNFVHSIYGYYAPLSTEVINAFAHTHVYAYMSY